MSAPLLWLLVAACVLLAVLLWRWERRMRTSLGLQGLGLVASDDSRIPTDTLFCAPLGLVGRPDHVVEVGGAYVPVEVKPSARVLRQSHTLQLAAQCLLVQYVHGERPPYGIAVLAEGRREIVPYSQELEHKVLDSLRDMRLSLLAEMPPGDTGSAAKCRGCSFGGSCPASRASALVQFLPRE